MILRNIYIYSKIIANAHINAHNQKITSNPYANKQLPHAPKHLKTKKYPNFLPYSKAL